MDTEIELKLLVAPGSEKILENQFFNQLSGSVAQSEFALSNCYYDTVDAQLRQNDIGLRVRGKNGQFEQTIKTGGKSMGGLHHRAEYNIPLSDSHPDLSLFEPSIWPPGLNVDALQDSIGVLFATNFVRRAYQYTRADDALQVEFAYDQGKVTANNHGVAICELEIELQRGSASELFNLAEQLAEVLPFRLGTLSKAARGYMLVKGTELEVLARPQNVPLNGDEDLEQILQKGLTAALAYWQHHEQVFCESGKLLALEGVWFGQKWLRQQLIQINSVLALAEIDALIQQLDQSLQQWTWVAQVLAMGRLRSSRGPFSKKLAPCDALQSYLHGRIHGLLAQYQPLQLINNGTSGLIQLRLLALLYKRPWQHDEKATQQAQVFARQWLQQSWLDVQGVLGEPAVMQADDYIAQEGILQQSVLRSLAIAELFNAEQRGEFRAGWLDVLDGIEELYTLRVLKRELGRAELADADELAQWCAEKTQRVLEIIHLSHHAALNMTPYW